LFTPSGYTFFAPNLLTDRDLYEYRVTQFLSDDNNVAWLGIWGLGPGRADLTINDLVIMPQGPYDDDVADIAVDGDEFWFLGGGDGFPGTITYYDRGNAKWEYFDPRKHHGIISDQFYTVTCDSRAVWIGTELGLVRMDRKSLNFKSYSTLDGIAGERVTALLPIKNNLLIGTDRGVSVMDFVRDTLYEANSDLSRQCTIFDFAVRDTVVYAATDLGILLLPWGGHTWGRLLLDSPYLRAPVYDIQVVDSLLFSVGDDGVVIVNLNDYSYSVHDRTTVFRNSNLTSLLIHKGVIWAAGNDGLFRYNERKANWYRYTQNDGLIAMRVRTVVGDGDYVWIGTDRGVTRFMWNNRDRSDWLQ
jgi:ligand-binding sensor domain-containing protein